MTLWIKGYEERKEVFNALMNNGYTIRLIERPNKKWPLTDRDYGIEIVEEPKETD
jgi:hypothetical protein